jgi:hypothetical protein
VRKFAGRERQLCAKLFKKYGEAPDLSPPAREGGQEAETKAKDAVIRPHAKYQRDFKPFPLARATASPLDLRSAEFDALRALQAPKKQIKLPVTTAYPLDNIQKCRHLVREEKAASCVSFRVLTEGFLVMYSSQSRTRTARQLL